MSWDRKQTTEAGGVEAPRREQPSPALGKKKMLTGALLCLGLLLPTPMVGADEGSGAVCKFSTLLRHRPGYLLTTTTRGAFATAEPAPVTCDGRFAGQELSSEPGTLTLKGAYEGTCLTAAGQGRTRIEVRTLQGDSLVLEGPVEVARSGLVLQGSGELDRVPFQLTMTGAPDPAHPEEDCVTGRLDHVLAFGVIAVGDTQPVVEIG